MLALIAASGIQADDIKARVDFTGSLFNSSTR